MAKARKPENRAAGKKRARKRLRSLKSWAPILALALALVTIFGGPPLVRYVKAPAISESFGIEDAVVAMRLEGEGISYLVLVNEAGETRSARLAERGFEDSRLAWTEAGLSTGDPRHEYVLHEEGLAKLAIPDLLPSPSERQRIASQSGFTVMNGSAEGTQAVFVDPAADRLTAVDAGYRAPELASCGDAVVAVTEDGVREVTPETRDFSGLDQFDNVEALACGEDAVFGWGGISDESRPREALLVWDRSGGEPREYELRYSEAVGGIAPSSQFVHDGRLYWVADRWVWAVGVPQADRSGAETGSGEPRGRAQVLEPVAVAEIGGSVGTDDPFEYDEILNIDSGPLTQAGGHLYGAAVDEEWVKKRRGHSYDRLEGMAIFGVDVTTGEHRVKLELGDIDFPRRDVAVRAIAVNPEWAVAR